MKYIKTTKGFTLIELSLFMGLFSIILLVLTTIFAELIQKQMEVQSMSAVESDKSYILSRLAYDIGRADTITIPASSGDSSNELEFQIDGTTYAYQLNESTLERESNGETLQVNNTRIEITNLTFQKIGNPGGNPTISVSMDITSLVKEASGQRNTSINTTFGMH